MNRVIVFLLLALAGTSLGEYRIWEAADGRLVEAEYAGKQGAKVVLRIRNGKRVPISPDQLSEDDQYYIRLQVPLKLKVDARDHREKSKLFEQSVQVSAEVRQTSSFDYPGKLRLTILQFGRHVESSNQAIVSKSSYDFTLPCNTVFTNATKFVGERSSFLNVKFKMNHYARVGYAAYVTDEFGKLIATTSMPSRSRKQIEKIMQFPEKKEFDKNCRLIDPEDEDSNRVEAIHPKEWMYFRGNREIGIPQEVKSGPMLFVRSKYGVREVRRFDRLLPGHSMKIRFILTDGKVGVIARKSGILAIETTGEEEHLLEISNNNRVLSFVLDGNPVAVRDEPLREFEDKRMPRFYAVVNSKGTLKILSYEIDSL